MRRGSRSLPPAAHEGALAKNDYCVRAGTAPGAADRSDGFLRTAAKQPRLHELSSRFRGLKPPRFPTVWEGVVNGIACQQLSLTVGIMLLNRLSAACGLAFETAGTACGTRSRGRRTLRSRLRRQCDH